MACSWEKPVVRIGMPSALMMTMPMTPLCAVSFWRVSSTSDWDWDERERQKGKGVQKQMELER